MSERKSSKIQAHGIYRSVKLFLPANKIARNKHTSEELFNKIARNEQLLEMSIPVRSWNYFQIFGANQLRSLDPYCYRRHDGHKLPKLRHKRQLISKPKTDFRDDV